MTVADEHQQHDAERGKGTSHPLLWMFVVLVIYVLSSGPAVRLHQKTTNAGLRSALNVFYMPLGFLIKETRLRPMGEWWLSLWVDLSDGH